MKFLIATKKEMSQIFTEDGKVVPVTRVIAGPCFVCQKKDEKKDGYRSIALAMNETKKVNKPLKTFFNKVFKKDIAYKKIKEFRMSADDSMYNKLNVGQELTADIFNTDDTLKVTGRSKGKGFQGVVKRYGFSGSPASHGHKDQLRMPGSIGATGPAHVFKGTRMGGRMGGLSQTTDNLQIVKINPETNEIFIKGAVPGARNSCVYLIAEGEFDIQATDNKQEEIKVEEKKDVVQGATDNLSTSSATGVARPKRFGTDAGAAGGQAGGTQDKKEEKK